MLINQWPDFRLEKLAFSYRLGRHLLLRAILCKNQAKKWEMKIFTSPQILHAIRYCGGISETALCSGCFFVVVMGTPIFCWWQKSNI